MPLRRRLGLALATLAIALHAFWPLIAQARPKSVALIPVCTIGGETHYTEVPLGKSPVEERSASHFEHCSLCTVGAAFLDSVAQQSELPDGAADGPAIGKAFSVKIEQPVAAKSRAPPFSR